MKFVGSYTKQYKDILIASALSGHNVLVISEKGWGKSDMARAAGLAVTGGNGFIWVELDPASPPEIIRGAFAPTLDPAKILERVVTGTPYDPAARIVVLDEIGRTNDIVLDALVHATNRKDIDPISRPVFWGTTNFFSNSPRTEALRDRFSFWFHMAGDLDVRAIAKSHLNNGTGIDQDWAKDFPTWQDCIDIRRAPLTERASDLVIDTVDTLCKEAAQQNFKVNPRRVVQWSEILACTAKYYSGTADFQSLPDKSTNLIQYAWPAVSEAEASSWAAVANSIADALGAAIEVYRAQAIEKFKEVVKQNASSRSTLMVSLAKVISDAQNDLEKIGGNDPRVNEVTNELTEIMSKAVRGEDI